MILNEWEKGHNEKIVAELTEYNGKDYFNLRVYFQKDGNWYPTKKGITLHVEALGALKEAIAKAEEHLANIAEIF